MCVPKREKTHKKVVVSRSTYIFWEHNSSAGPFFFYIFCLTQTRIRPRPLVKPLVRGRESGGGTISAFVARPKCRFPARKTKLLHLDFTGRDAVSNFNECDWRSSVKNLHRRNATSSRRASICVCLCQVAAVPTPGGPTLFSCILFCLPFTAHGCIAQ